MSSRANTFTEAEAREAVVAAGVRLVRSGLIARTWGNVSARIGDGEFLITPTGRDYLSLTPEEIVPVRIDDLSHRGALKPSGERGVHAAIYDARPDVQFVVHTHQHAASAVSATALGGIDVSDQHPLLGGHVPIAGYGLPSTKRLRENVAAALDRTPGHAIIMGNHGTVCFGTDPDEVFQAALQLEQACTDSIRTQYRVDKRIEHCDDDRLRKAALVALARPYQGRTPALSAPLHASERTADGFVLHGRDGDLLVSAASNQAGLDVEARVHAAIYRRHPSVGAIVPADAPDVIALSHANMTVRPLLDDFAQLVGTRARTVFGEPEAVARAAARTNAVFIVGLGALCLAADADEADAVRTIVTKNATAYVWSAAIGRVRPLPRVDAALMRAVYQRKYSKEIGRNVA